jgi:protease-4
MTIWESLRVFFSRSWVRWSLLILLAVGVGWLLAVLWIPAPQVGVIHFPYAIWPETAEWLEAQLRYAEEDPSIRAIVIEVDSPGGEASTSERLYFEVLRLRKNKPVLVKVNTMAASGAYYLAAAADEILATPSSDVGNIGVISMLPEPSFVVEDYLFTGPFKAFGSPRDSYMRQMEVLKESFLESVWAQRGHIFEEKAVDRTTLSRGEVYVGTLSLQMGLIDALGSRQDAVDRAAELANLRHFSVVDITEVMSTTGQLPTLYQGLSPENLPTRLAKDNWGAGYYFLYIPPTVGEPHAPQQKGGE